jgi:hypothetical protein
MQYSWYPLGPSYDPVSVLHEVSTSSCLSPLVITIIFGLPHFDFLFLLSSCRGITPLFSEFTKNQNPVNNMFNLYEKAGDNSG